MTNTAGNSEAKSTETKETVDTKTLLVIASLSKAFKVASMRMRVDEGKLD